MWEYFVKTVSHPYNFKNGIFERFLSSDVGSAIVHHFTKVIKEINSQQWPLQGTVREKLNKSSGIKGEREEGRHFFCLLSLHSFRVTLKASCPMDLRLYPMDVQHCPLIIESCKINSLYLFISYANNLLLFRISFISI